MDNPLAAWMAKAMECRYKEESNSRGPTEYSMVVTDTLTMEWIVPLGNSYSTETL